MQYAGFAGGWEWVIILLAVLILFGAKRIPEFAKAKNDIEKSLDDK